MSEKMLAVPGGDLLWPKSLCHFVPPGFNWHHQPDNTHILIRRSDGKPYRLQKPSKEALEWKAETEIAKKLAIQARMRDHFAAVPDGGVWQARAGVDSTNYITQFNATWNVPVPPNVSHEHGQALFYWNGISPTFSAYPLLQPVLQYGASSAGTPSSWGLACWHIYGLNSAAYSSLYEVASNTALVGSIARISSTQVNVDFVVGGSVVTGLVCSDVNGNNFFHADMVLENKSMTECADNVVNGVDMHVQFISDINGYATLGTWEMYSSGNCSYSATNHSLSHNGGYVTLQA